MESTMIKHWAKITSALNATGLRAVDLVEELNPAPAGLAPAERRTDHYRLAFNHSSPFFPRFRRPARGPGGGNEEKTAKGGWRGGVSSCQSCAPLGQAQRGRHRPRTVCACLLFAAALCCGWPRTVSAQSAEAAKPKQYEGAELKYKGIDRCAFCHVPSPDREPVDGMKYYKFNEYKTWKDEDKHSMAYEVLAKSNSTSEQIGRLLGTDPQTDPRCLSCHGLVIDAIQYKPAMAKLQPRGVSCEACHGPSSYWGEKHNDPEQWRQNKKFTRAERVKAGMTDLRDPEVRADKCLSCHLGSMEEGKVLTHEMYAAGHPPVSGFEIETFLGDLPRHWRGKITLPPEYEKEYGKPEKEYSSRMVALAGLVALRNYARLLRDDARQRKADGASAPAELAHYDCQACHHELSIPSWRQQRGYRGQPPGRPRVRTWPLALAKLRLAGAGEDATAKDLDALYGALGSRPFGDPEKVAAAASRLADATQASIDKLKSTRFDAKDASAMFARLCQAGLEEVPDFESARQFGWALCIVSKDLPPSAGKEADPQTLLTALAAELALNLPPGKKPAYDTSIAQSLEAASKYKPEQFQQHLQELKKLVGDRP
jgi:hypothetical protein